MKHMEELKSKLMRVVEEMSRKGDLNMTDLEKLQKLTDTIKNIDKIEMLEDDGYSQRGNYSRGGDWEAEMRGRYDRENSYRGRKRDSMGRYSRDGEGQGGGYSRHGDDYERMERMMMDEGIDRDTIRRCMDAMRE